MEETHFPLGPSFPQVTKLHSVQKESYLFPLVAKSAVILYVLCQSFSVPVPHQPLTCEMYKKCLFFTPLLLFHNV